jgi:hypothetical protein
MTAIVSFPLDVKEVEGLASTVHLTATVFPSGPSDISDIAGIWSYLTG